MNNDLFDEGTQNNAQHCVQPSLSEYSKRERNNIIGLIASLAPPLLTPKIIEELIEEGNTIYIERGFGSWANIPDIAYADAGAEIFENASYILFKADILLKNIPFNTDEMLQMSEKRVIISSLSSFIISQKAVHSLIQKKILGLAFNLFQNHTKENILDCIEQKSNTKDEYLKNLSSYISEVLRSFLMSRNLKSTLQLNPQFLSGVYCYNGYVCQKEMAIIARVPYKSIVDLCWDWN